MKTGAPASRSAALLAPKQPNLLIATLDIAVVMTATLAAAHYFSPADPLLLKQPFPWLWLPPAFLALRYGTLGAAGAAACIISAWAAQFIAGNLPETIPEQVLLGGLVLTLGIARFNDIWRGRLRRVRAVNHYLDQRLDALTQQHYLLKKDYQRMEQGLLEKPLTLRHALQGLRDLVPADKAPDIPLPHAQGFLELLAHACQLETASLHAFNKGRLVPAPLATLGEAGKLHASDPMLLLALQHNELCHVQTEALHESDSQYLIAAPVLNTSGKRLGMLLVERLPFLSLNQEALQLLNVVLGYYADLVSTAPEVADIHSRMPDCPLSFAEELVRLHHIYRECKIPSTLVALSFDTRQKTGSDHFYNGMKQRRQLDLVWTPADAKDRRLLITLMPLYGPQAASGYVKRLKKIFAETPGTESRESISAIAEPVDQRSPSDLLARLLERCHVMAR